MGNLAMKLLFVALCLGVLGAGLCYDVDKDGDLVAQITPDDIGEAGPADEGQLSEDLHSVTELGEEKGGSSVKAAKAAVKKAKAARASAIKKHNGAVKKAHKALAAAEKAAAKAKAAPKAKAAAKKAAAAKAAKKKAAKAKAKAKAK